MPSGIKNKGPFARPASDLSAKAQLPGLTGDAATPQAPDVGLSAAFRHVLGGKAGQPHLPGSSLKTGQEIAKRAKTEKPGAPSKAAPRKAHIGPRSGHK